MEITIIGTGSMARGIGTRAVGAGHVVRLVGRQDEKAAALAGELGASAAASGDHVTGDVVILAVPYSALGDVLSHYGDDFDGKVVVDITNPMDFTTFEPIKPEAGSAAEEIAAARPGAKVVKAFNTTFAGTLVDGRVAGQSLDVLLAGDDAGAKETIAHLVEESGLRPIDAGPLRRARELEAVGFLHISLQQPLGTGFGSALKILS